MLKQAFVVVCAVVGIACAGLFAAQAQGQTQVQACKDACHRTFLQCTPTSSKNMDNCRGPWQTCDAAFSK